METKIESIIEKESENLNIDVGGFPALQEVERKYVELVLERAKGNKSQAAKVLGISIKTIYNKIENYRKLDKKSMPNTLI